MWSRKHKSIAFNNHYSIIVMSPSNSYFKDAIGRITASPAGTLRSVADFGTLFCARIPCIDFYRA